jgi:hypothetical protein
MQPTNTDLKLYSIVQCNAIQRIYYDFESVTSCKTLETYYFNVIKDACSPGQLVYDNVELNLKLKAKNGTWINVTQPTGYEWNYGSPPL